MTSRTVTQLVSDIAAGIRDCDFGLVAIHGELHGWRRFKPGLGIGELTSHVPLATPARLYECMGNITTSNAPLLDVNQVAERLCVSPRFVRRLIDERRIPFCKLGKFVRFEPGDVDAWVAEHRVEAVGR